MSIARFCDHRVVIYRYDAANPDYDEFRDIIPNWQPLTVPAGLNATVQRNWGGDLNDAGPGEIQGTKRHWFLLPGFDVRERDVLQVVSGPPRSEEVGRLYRVESVSAGTRPIELHHWEVMASVAEPNILQVEAETS